MKTCKGTPCKARSIWQELYCPNPSPCGYGYHRSTRLKAGPSLQHLAPCKVPYVERRSCSRLPFQRWAEIMNLHGDEQGA
jgi:hypothetical protein